MVEPIIISSLPQDQREQAIIQVFNNIGIELYSGGTMDYDLENEKKITLDSKRRDHTPKIPSDNSFKFRPDETPYLVVDADGIEIDQLVALYPSIENTFYTVTTKQNHRHYYLLPPEGLTWPKTSKTKVLGPHTYDLLVYYNLFEGHAYDKNPNYAIIPNEPKRATLQEYNRIKEIFNSNKLKSISSKKARLAKPKIKNAILKYIDGTNTEKDEYFLVRALYPDREELKGTKKPTFTKWFFESRNNKLLPDHNKFNFMAWKVTYTELSYEERNAFIDKILENNGIDPTSALTKKHLHDSIYATLPMFGPLDIGGENSELLERAQAASNNDSWGVLKFQGGKDYNYMQINLATLEPRAIGENNTPYYGLKRLEIDYLDSGASPLEIAYSIPTVKLVNKPFSPRIYYDEKNDIDVYNLAPKSEYYMNATPNSSRPEGLMMRLLDSYFGKYVDYYDHWLAHHMYSTQPPAVSLIAVAGEHVKGGTGKTTVTASLPSKLIPTVKRVGEDVLMSNFSPPPGISLQVFNDLTKPEMFSSHVYPEIKDGSTGGAPKLVNIKYGGQIEVEDATGYAVSANFFPQLDADHDRRMWVVVAQHTEGRTDPLTEEEALELYSLTEGPRKDEYIDELQEYANYLKYLYLEERNKYNKQLYIEAPKTEYFAKCLGGTYSSRLYSMLQNNPEEILEYIPAHRLDDISRIFRFIVYLYEQHDKNYVAIPYGILGEILELMGSIQDHKDYSPARIKSVMNIESITLRNASLISQKYYHNTEDMRKHDLKEEWAELPVSSQLKLIMKEEVMDIYKRLSILSVKEEDKIDKPILN